MTTIAEYSRNCFAYVKRLDESNDSNKKHKKLLCQVKVISKLLQTSRLSPVIYVSTQAHLAGEL
jgi:hypothetical protein